MYIFNSFTEPYTNRSQWSHLSTKQSRFSATKNCGRKFFLFLTVSFARESDFSFFRTSTYRKDSGLSPRKIISLNFPFVGQLLDPAVGAEC